ncbi:RDD family protein [Nonomuraea sp. NPDC046570]|uniref:RDD family protein n=1 Tax=Nonomuraea sp. NPDC046570 TaxID=3155255 RepID=UPI0033DB1965
MALLMWMVALVVAAVSTWEEWRLRLQPGEYSISSCAGWSREGSLLAPLRGDLDDFLESIVAWALPAPLVLLGFLACLGRGDPRSAGRRVAGVLCLIAVLEPLTPVYSGPDTCDGPIPILSVDWFATVMSSWGTTQLCLLTAAGLVLLASWTMRRADREHRGTGPQPGTARRRLLAILVDYLIVAAVLIFVVQPILFLTDIDGFFPSINLEYGLLNWINLFEVNNAPERLAVLPAVFLYFWVQHLLWQRTLGKRLLRVRVVSAGTTDPPGAKKAALRALVFPLLAIVPTVGPLILIVDGLYALFDSYDRTLHDRWAGTNVIRRIPKTQPQG